MNPRWPNAVRASVSTAIPIVAGWAAGNLGSGLMATLGAFTSRFGGDRPYANRAQQLAVVAIALASAVAAGSWAAQWPWLGVAVVSVVAVAAVWLCNALAVGPPGAYVFVLACAAGIGASAAHLAPWQVGALVLAGGAVAWLIQMSGACVDKWQPERVAVAEAGDAVADYVEAVGSPGETAARHSAAAALQRSWNVLVNFQPRRRRADETVERLRAANHALHVLFTDSMSATAAGEAPAPAAAATARGVGSLVVAPDTIVVRDTGRMPLGRPRGATLLRRAVQPGSHVRHVMVRVAIAAPLAGAVATLLGIGHAYWAIAAAVLVLHQGVDRDRTLRRGADRLVGTWVGLALAAGILWLHPHGLLIALIVAVLQFTIQLLVVNHYGLASVFITAAALTIATGSREVDVATLLLDRGCDTLVGCAIGAAVYLVTSRFQESRRLADAVADTIDAVAATATHLASDAASLRARTARREVQLAALNLRDASDAAAAGSVSLRASLIRLRPAVAATERLAYDTIAACWAMEAGGGTPLLGTKDALAYRAQLHRLAVAVRSATTPTEVDFETDVLRDEVTALREALRET